MTTSPLEHVAQLDVPHPPSEDLIAVPPLQRAAEEFAAQLGRWRIQRGMSKRTLAKGMGFDPSYVSHVEGRRHRPTRDFARLAEEVLRTGGAITRSYEIYDALRQSPIDVPAHRESDDAWLPPGTGLVIDREHATLTLRDDGYHVLIRRRLYNAGIEPVIRFPVRIHVDRFPEHPRRSARLHHDEPLNWTELGFAAECYTGPGAGTAPEPAADGDVAQPEPMTWRTSYEADAVKELWLHFENPERRFPLYPGQRTTIEYGYQVASTTWGTWFQRSVRLPTRELAVELDFPTAEGATVWGTVNSLTAQSAPLATPIGTHVDGDRTRFSWSVRNPVLAARYLFEWRLRA